MYPHIVFRIAYISLAACSSLFAQTAPTQIVGTVADPSGAAVGGAQVVLSSEARGFAYRAETQPDGFYSVSNLLPGLYRLDVSKNGFQTFSQSGISAVTAKSVRVDLTLSVGASAESVTVSADASLLDTATQEIGQTIDNRRVIELPLNGRSYLELASLAPNAVPLTK